MERPRRRDRDDLPDDMLAEVLRRLPPRWLAVSRCVRKAWRRAIDESRLLRADLLPLSLAGIFMQFEEHIFPEFFARPCSRKINANLDFLPPIVVSSSDELYDESLRHYIVFGHCNGLLLVNDYVVNPATRCWDPLTSGQPLADPMGIADVLFWYLAFDPTVSPHYQVFNIPYLRPRPYKPGDPSYRSPRDDVDPLVEKSEWPPSTCIMNVFSSRSGRWEERYFAREGDAAGVVAELRRRLHHGSAYWRQALYVHCQSNFVMRISLTDEKYRVIKPPADMDDRAYPPHIGKSRYGVYFASFMKDIFRVWILRESHDHREWILKGEYDLKHVGAFDPRVHGPWALEDVNYELVRSQLSEVNEKAIAEETFQWNSDDDDDNRVGSQLPEVNKRASVKDRWEEFHDYVDANGNLVEGCIYGCNVLGFHPYKEIIFFSSFGEHEWMATVHAYHLNSSRIVSLGNMSPTRFDRFAANLPELGVHAFFPYTPCWTGEYPRHK